MVCCVGVFACLRLAVAVVAGLALAGCAAPGGGVPFGSDEPLVAGPVIQDIVTPFDRALSCLDGRINRDVLRFSVGAVIDATGKEQLSESGTGKFVTQGAGDIVQSALFQAGVALVNRRDPRVIDAEAKWGIRDTKSQLSSTFFITGSVNSLDFLPGSGFDIQVAGVGPRGRQHRILVGLDLSMTETRTGRVVANIPLQKQIVAAEEGFGVGRFFGTTLVNLDVGNRHREALNFAMRQMLHLATFELLTQMMKPEQFVDCWEMVEGVHGVLGNTRASSKIAQYRAAQLSVGAPVAAKSKPKALA
jgi:curli biogenesis system outer membrane secretion channel CsgG